MINIPGLIPAQASLAAGVMDEPLMPADQADEMLTPEQLQQVSGGASFVIRPQLKF